MRTIVFTCLMLVCPCSLHASEIDAAKAAAYVKSLQTLEGAFVPSKRKGEAPTVASIGSTSAGVRALKYLGEDVPNKEGCSRFIDSCFDPQAGGFKPTPSGQVDVSATAVGLMAVVQLKMPLEKYAAAAGYMERTPSNFEEIRIAAAGFETIGRQSAKEQEWVQSVRKNSNAEGLFGPSGGKARETGSAVVTLLRLHTKAPDARRVLDLLDQQQDASGGWRKDEKAPTADLETTYRVMRCYHMLKAQPKGRMALRDFLAKCQNADGGFGPSPGEPSSVSNTYFAAVITHWMKMKE